MIIKDSLEILAILGRYDRPVSLTFIYGLCPYTIRYNDFTRAMKSLSTSGFIQRVRVGGKDLYSTTQYASDMLALASSSQTHYINPSMNSDDIPF